MLAANSSVYVKMFIHVCNGLYRPRAVVGQTCSPMRQVKRNNYVQYMYHACKVQSSFRSH